MGGDRDSEPVPVTCQQEVEGLHAFFVDWYTGENVTFDRVERALAPEFVMISPDGDRVERDAILDVVRDQRERYDPGEFAIDIRKVETVETTADLAVLRYEEWQTTDGDETGRISTACFRADPAAPEGVVWTALHETWLEE